MARTRRFDKIPLARTALAEHRRSYQGLRRQGEPPQLIIGETLSENSDLAATAAIRCPLPLSAVRCRCPLPLSAAAVRCPLHVLHVHDRRNLTADDRITKPLSVFPDSLCHRCSHMRYVQSKRSTFLMCTEASLPKYPAQPVRACEKWQSV